MTESPAGKELCKEQIRRIAGVMARWQTNGHTFHPRGETSKEGQSVIYRHFAKMLHSCEPNCTRDICADTGCIAVRTISPVKAGDVLSIDYMGRNQDFLV